MPTLKIFGTEPLRDPADGHLFDRLPIAARRDPRLSPAAILLLAALIPKGGPWPSFVELTDDRLIEETGQSHSAIQRHFQQLEAAGWVQRVRRRGRRKIFLLFDLAGAQGQCMHSPDPGSALPRIGDRTPHLRVMHFPGSGTQDLRGEKEKDPSEKGGSPSAASPLAGCSPTTTPTKPEQTQTQADDPTNDPATWTEATAREWQAIADDPNQPFRKFAAKLLAGYHLLQEQRTQESRQATGPPPKVTRLPGFEDQGEL